MGTYLCFRLDLIIWNIIFKTKKQTYFLHLEPMEGAVEGRPRADIRVSTIGSASCQVSNRAMQWQPTWTSARGGGRLQAGWESTHNAPLQRPGAGRQHDKVSWLSRRRLSWIELIFYRKRLSKWSCLLIFFLFLKQQTTQRRQHLQIWLSKDGPKQTQDERPGEEEKKVIIHMQKASSCSLFTFIMIYLLWFISLRRQR